MSEATPLVGEVESLDPQQKIINVAREILLAGIPYRQQKLPDGSFKLNWQRKAKTVDGFFRLKIIASDEVGLPFGKDRVLLAWLQDKALKQGDPFIQWANAIDFFNEFSPGKKKGGFSYKQFYDSFKRLAYCSATIEYLDDKNDSGRNLHLIEGWSLPRLQDKRSEENGTQLLPGMAYGIILDPTVWEYLQKSPVPLDLELMKKFQNSPLGWDLVSFICFRVGTASINNGFPVFVSWDDLKDQLGSEQKNDKELRREIRSVLEKLSEQWPEVRVELQHNGPLRIDRPSKNVQPVPKRKPKDAPVEQKPKRPRGRPRRKLIEDGNWLDQFGTPEQLKNLLYVKYGRAILRSAFESVDLGEEKKLLVDMGLRIRGRYEEAADKNTEIEGIISILRTSGSNFVKDLLEKSQFLDKRKKVEKLLGNTIEKEIERVNGFLNG